MVIKNPREFSVQEFERMTVGYLNSNSALQSANCIGSDWYQNAHSIACDIASKTEFSVAQSSAILAITSANNGWRDNVSAAYAYCVHGANVHTAAQMKKCHLVRSENDPKKLRDIVFGRAGYKTASFYQNILYPEIDLGAVTIDRWICAIYGLRTDSLVGKYGHSDIVYQRLEQAIVNVARSMDELPQDLQAKKWCFIRGSSE